MPSRNQQRVAHVCLGNALLPVGKLRFSRQARRQHSEFQYAESWTEDRRAFAIAPNLPVSLTPYYASMASTDDPRDSLPAVFQDAAPDAWGRLLMERVHGAGLSEFDMLTLSDDTTRQGALRFCDMEGEVIRTLCDPVPNVLQLEALREAAGRIEQRRDLSNEDLRQLAGAGGSIGGARPKANVADDDGLWIAKFSSIGDMTPVERIEVATLLLARECGLRVPEARLMLEGTAHPVAMIRRFDRRSQVRIPYFSARTALERSGTEQGSYTEIAEVIRVISRAPRADLHELWARIVFSVLITNTDDHLKNHGFVYAGDGLWRLSQMFDVNPQAERHRYLKTAIMEGAPFEARIELAMEAAEFFDLPERAARKMARDMAERIADRWKPFMRNCGVGGADCRALASAFEHEEAEIARQL